MELSSIRNPSASQERMTNPWYPPPRASYNFVMESTPSTSREQRNRAEKQRRDRLNGFIGELATQVPMVAKSAKRMDKTSILRLTATYLRIYHTLINSKGIRHMQLPKYIDQVLLEQLVLEQLGGFLLILQSNGKIIFVSHTVENLLGHLQTDLMGQTLYNITSPDDHDRLKFYLQYDGELDAEYKKNFNLKLKRAGPRSETAVFEPVRLMGMYRLATNSPSSSPLSTTSSSSSSCTNDILVFFVKICRPKPLQDRLIQASRDEYITRHLIDGRIITCDQRIAIIAGYLTEEVSGHSAFSYMHRDDVRWVIIALRQMYDRGESKGSSCYRLQSRNGQFIYLKTFGFLEIDDQGIVESFVCINTLVPEAEGKRLINDMKNRYSALINSNLTELECTDASIIPTVSSEPSMSVDLVEDPQKVEEAVEHLMHNLPSPTSDHCSTPSPLGNFEEKDCNSLCNKVSTVNSPSKIIHVRFKTGQKRPPSTDVHIQSTMKRQKTSPPHVSPAYTNVGTPPYQQISSTTSTIKEDRFSSLSSRSIFKAENVEN